MKHGKKYNDSSKLVDRTKLYDVDRSDGSVCQDRYRQI